MRSTLKTCVTLFVVLIVVAIFVRRVFWAHAATATTTDVASSSTLQTQIANNSRQIAALNQQIAGYKAELKAVGADKQTLQRAINALELQRKSVQVEITVTRTQIGTTQLQIKQLGSQIGDAEQAIATSQSALGSYLKELQKDDDKSLLVEMLRSGSLAQVWSDVTATEEMQGAVQKNMQALQAQKSGLADSKTASEAKRTALAAQQQQLASQQQTLATTVQSKNQLLADTKAKESNYQKLLAQAEAQLQSFATFTQNAGGSKLLANQTSCDDWGCYYNQRDTAWGADSLDGTKYTLAQAGCLVAAMAMVLTHYGYKDVTPVTINADPDNFAPYAQDLLMQKVYFDGGSATRIKGSLDAILASGHPAIVGLNAYGGTHFIVIVSGSKGDYVMRDPYVADGKDISFSSHYTVKEIFTAAKVVING